MVVGGYLFDAMEGSTARQGNPEVPVLINVQRLIEPYPVGDQFSVDQRGMYRQEIGAIQATQIEWLVQYALNMAFP